jgi:hypothetical protein
VARSIPKSTTPSFRIGWRLVSIAQACGAAEPYASEQKRIARAD